MLKKSGARWMVDGVRTSRRARRASSATTNARPLLVGFTDAHYADNDIRQRTEQHGYERLMRLLAQIYDEEANSRGG